MLFLLQMCHCIEKVFQLAVATFNKAASAESSKRNLELLISQTNKLRSTDVGLEYCSVFRSSHSHRLVSSIVDRISHRAQCWLGLIWSFNPTSVEYPHTCEDNKKTLSIKDWDKGSSYLYSNSWEQTCFSGNFRHSWRSKYSTPWPSSHAWHHQVS